MTGLRLAIAILLLASGAAHACLFATKTPPEGWYQWSDALFAGDVAAVERSLALAGHGVDRTAPDEIVAHDPWGTAVRTVARDA